VSEEAALPAESAEESADAENSAAPASDGAYAFSEQGVVSYISDSLHGNLTASGEPYDKDAMVAAHKSLPFGTEVRVTNLFNGRSVQVVIMDRLPVNNPHLIDVSSAAGRQLELKQVGNADALVEWNE
jgi:rare lipoprotein A